MKALIRMRLTGFVIGGRVVAPAFLVLIVLGILYGGGQSSAVSAYSYSATVLFPVLAVSTKLILDAEPDVQRRLARTAIGSMREAAAGVLAATLLGLAVCLLAMIAPWVVFAIEPEKDLASGVLLGALAHLLALVCAVAIGALSSRAVTRTIGRGVAVLASGTVLTFVLGLSGSIAPFLAPPVLAVARALNNHADAARLSLLCGWAACWSLVALIGYIALRDRRA